MNLCVVSVGGINYNSRLAAQNILLYKTLKWQNGEQDAVFCVWVYNTTTIFMK